VTGGHQGTEYRLIMTVIGVLCCVGAAAGIWPIVDLIASSVVAALLVGAPAAGCVAAVHRELRIRRRLAAIQPLATAGRARTDAEVPR
jgi:hypothetical protein